MTGTDEGLGGRLALVVPEQLTDDQRKLYDHLAQKMFPAAASAGFQATSAGGRPIGPFNAVVIAPGVGSGLVAFMEAESASTSLGDTTRQAVILAVGAVWKAGYELYAHSAEAGSTGFDEGVISALVAGEVPDKLTPADRAAARVARQLTQERQVDETTYASAQRIFGDRGMVEIVLLVGYYQTVCGVLSSFRVPVPPTT